MKAGPGKSGVGAVPALLLALAAWGCTTGAPPANLGSVQGGVRQAGYIDLSCMSGLGMLNRMPCTMTSEKHGASVRIAPGEQVCSVTPTDVSVSHAATSTYHVGQDAKGVFVEARAVACPTGPFFLGPPSSVKVRWIVTTVPAGQANPQCDFKTSGQLPGPPPACG